MRHSVCEALERAHFGRDPSLGVIAGSPTRIAHPDRPQGARPQGQAARPRALPLRIGSIRHLLDVHDDFVMNISQKARIRQRKRK